MPKILQLSSHVANLIAAGEVVERPASAVKELLENAVDAGASKVTIEIRDGGMTFLRVTDNGCGMSAEDARTAFLRHATSKLRTEEDLAAIGTMGFRGEALAAIASVSRIDLMTKTPGSLSGVKLHLDAGVITEEAEAGCPDGTTILVRDLFYNTPARMKFMKSDTVEGSRVAAAVQMQALAHPEVAFQFLRDGKQVLATPGSGKLQDAMYCVYGRDCARMVAVESRWESYTLSGFVTLPTDARPSRNLQTFFVNDRPVKSKLLIAALEEAYRNQLMVGRFPGCVLHLNLPANAVDVNVHPAKTEVKFLSEKAVFDCVHYGVLGALNKKPDRPAVQFKPQPAPVPPEKPTPSPEAKPAEKKEAFFRTMTAQEYKTFSAAMADAPKPRPETAAAAAKKIPAGGNMPLREFVMLPQVRQAAQPEPAPSLPPLPETPKPSAPEMPVKAPEPEMEQTALEMPKADTWRMVGELYRTYILVEEGDNAFLIDKHAAHERMNFDRLMTSKEPPMRQTLLQPIAVEPGKEDAALLLDNLELLEQFGFGCEDFGDGAILVREVPADLDAADTAATLEEFAQNLRTGRNLDEKREALLHTMACKAAIKGGWTSDPAELKILVEKVQSGEVRYCPHGRPVVVKVTKYELEKLFKRA